MDTATSVGPTSLTWDQNQAKMGEPFLLPLAPRHAEMPHTSPSPLPAPKPRKLDR